MSGVTALANAAPAEAEEEAARLRRAWRVFAVTSLGVMLTFLNSSTLNVALPSLAQHFRAGPAEAGWVLLSYMLFNTVFILIFGRLSDLLGRRRLYLLGLTLFILGSLGCAFAPSMPALVALRAVQAIGAAAVITNTTALLTDAFPSHALSLGLGWNATMAAAAQVAGPVLGGAVVEAFGWRAVFLFNLPFGLIGLALAWRVLGRARPAPAERFDMLGSALFLAALGGLLVALSTGGAQGWGSLPCLLGFTLAALTGPAFLLSQKARAQPLLDLALFADPARRAAYLAVATVAAAQNGGALLLALFLRSVQGMDALAAGGRVMIMALGMMAMAPLAGRLATRLPSRPLCATGLALIAAGLLGLAAILHPGLGDVPVALGLMLVGLGTGLFMTPNTASIMTSVGPARRGVANGVRSTLQNTGSVVGMAAGLALATGALSAESKSAVYGTSLALVPASEVEALVGGYRAALAMLGGLALLGLAALWQGRSRAGSP